MRKCYLCGSLIRRKAEFCRYCTVRQRDATTTTAPEPAFRPADHPEEWLMEDAEDPAVRDQRDREAAAAFEEELRLAASGRVDRRPVLAPPPPPPPPAPDPAAAAPPPPPSVTWSTDTVMARTEVQAVPVSPTRTNGSAGTNGHNGTNGSNGTHTGNGSPHPVEQLETVEPAASETPETLEPCANDHLRGFDDFPRASKPSVRWG